VKEELLARKLISERDLKLYRIVHSPKEGVDYIKRFYSTYHSTRQVRDKLVVRLERELTDTAIQKLTTEFADIVKKGAVEKTRALPEETNEPDLLDKPRIMFSFDRKSPSRLIEMVWRINELGS
jgi:hypothetical protein